MMQRVLIEFVVEVPNEGVAHDVETRLASEHYAKLCDVIQSVTGHVPLQAPGERGLFVVTESVTWDASEQDWVGPDDDDDDDDDDDA